MEQIRKRERKKQYNFLELFWQNYFVLVIKLQPVSDKLPVHAQIVDEMFSADFLSIYSRTYGVNSFRSAENMNHQMTVHLFGPAYWKSRENIFSDRVISQIGTRFACVCACVCVFLCPAVCVCWDFSHCDSSPTCSFSFQLLNACSSGDLIILDHFDASYPLKNLLLCFKTRFSYRGRKLCLFFHLLTNCPQSVDKPKSPRPHVGKILQSRFFRGSDSIFVNKMKMFNNGIWSRRI